MSQKVAKIFFEELDFRSRIMSTNVKCDWTFFGQIWTRFGTHWTCFGPGSNSSGLFLVQIGHVLEHTQDLFLQIL